MLQFIKSGPALATTGALLVKTTSSKVEQAPFETVQRIVTEAPKVKPVMVEVALVEFVITAPFGEPLTVHLPVVPVGALPARVKSVLLQLNKSGPALEAINWLFVKTTSSLEEHAPFVKVQRNVTGVPTGTFCTVIVLEVRLDKLVVANEEGLTTVHAPDAGAEKVVAFG